MIQRKAFDPIDHQRGGVTAGDTLEVSGGDVAIFVRQGQLVRVLQLGTYQVPAEFAGPDMEVLFVMTRPIRDEKFGGNLPGGLPVQRAFGQFSWRILDPERAVIAVGLSDAIGISRWVSRCLFDALKPAVANAHLKGAPIDGIGAAAMVAANEKLGAQGVEVSEVTELQMQ